MADNGLIHGFRLDGQGGATALSWDTLNRGIDDWHHVWLHFDYTQADAAAWLRQSSGLDSLVVDALLSSDTRPRCSFQQEQMLLALRGVNLNPGADPEDMVSIRVWTDGQRIITSRHRLLQSVSALAKGFPEGSGPTNVGDFLCQLGERLTSRISAAIDRIQDQVAEIEEQIVSAQSYDLRKRISELRREVIGLRRYLAPQREAMQQMQSAPCHWLDEQHRSQIREQLNHLIRDIEDLDAIRDRAAVAHEELNNRLSEQLNNRMYVLSIIAAIFLPLGFLTGLLGINVGGMPGADNSEAFWIVCALLTLATSLQLWLFKRKNWL